MITDTADEGAFFGVRADVDYKVRFAGIGLKTAFPGALVAAFGVCALMLPEQVHVFEDTETALDHRASVRANLLRVDMTIVLREVRLELELLVAAFGAGEGSKVEVRLEVYGQVGEGGMGFVGLGAAIEGTEFVAFLLENRVSEVLGLTGGSNILGDVFAARFAHFHSHHGEELAG